MKDPALLWYFNDWMGGTATMSRHLKGCYIDLLCVQFNNGPLSLEDIKTVLGSDFGSWPALQKKFKCENTLYFNQRLQDEKDKRVKFTDSRRKNAKHMPMHMEDINEDRNRSKNVLGEFRNVLLLDSEIEKLHARFGEANTQIYIEKLSTYMESKQKRYNSHYATITGWLRRDIENRVSKLQAKGKQIVGL